MQPQKSRPFFLLHFALLYHHSLSLHFPNPFPHMIPAPPKYPAFLSILVMLPDSEKVHINGLYVLVVLLFAISQNRHFPFSVRLIDTLMFRQNRRDILNIFGKIFFCICNSREVAGQSRVQSGPLFSVQYG